MGCRRVRHAPLCGEDAASVGSQHLPGSSQDSTCGHHPVSIEEGPKGIYGAAVEGDVHAASGWLCAICRPPILAELFRRGQHHRGSIREGEKIRILHAIADRAVKFARNPIGQRLKGIEQAFDGGCRYGPGEAHEPAKVEQKDIRVGNDLSAVPLLDTINRDWLGKAFQREIIDKRRLDFRLRQGKTGGQCEIDLVRRGDVFEAGDECQRFTYYLAQSAIRV
jgi:hypothetical protein